VHVRERECVCVREREREREREKESEYGENLGRKKNNFACKASFTLPFNFVPYCKSPKFYSDFALFGVSTEIL